MHSPTCGSMCALGHPPFMAIRCSLLRRPQPTPYTHPARDLETPARYGGTVWNRSERPSAAITMVWNEGGLNTANRRALATAAACPAATATTTATAATASVSEAAAVRSCGGRVGVTLGFSGQRRRPSFKSIHGIDGPRGFFSYARRFRSHSLRPPTGACHLTTLVAR